MSIALSIALSIAVHQCALLLVAGSAGLSAAGAQPSMPFEGDLRCDSLLTRLFAPPVPSASPVEYLVCQSGRALDALRPATWPTRETSADEAFAGASPAVRRTLARLYGGRRLQVAHGWIADGDRLDSFALIAPPPADSLDRIATGTLIIRTRTQRRRPEGGGL